MFVICCCFLLLPNIIEAQEASWSIPLNYKLKLITVSFLHLQISQFLHKLSMSQLTEWLSLPVLLLLTALPGGLMDNK